MATIDSSIALGVKPIQLEDPINRFARQQELSVNMLKAQEMQRGMQNRNMLSQLDLSDPDYVNKAYRIDPQLGIQAQKSQLEGKKAQLDLDTAYMKNSRETLIPVNDQNGFSAWRSQAISRMPALANLIPEQYSPEVKTNLLMTADKYLDMNKPVVVGSNSALVNPQTGQPIFTNRPVGGGTEIPKLRPGEKWNAKEERVDLVPGSELYNKTASKHTKDYAAANSFATKSDDAIKKIDTILDPANKDGFESNFGGYNAYATRLKSGNTAKIRREIDSLQNALKVAGLDQIRQGGSIGAITQAEWPILQQMVAALTPDLNEEDARIKLQDIKAKFESIKADARDSYATTWDRTQFYKTKPGAASDKSDGDSGGVDTNNPLLK
jgi:hypothetical protein